jgi:hypothetical protein
MISLKNLLQPSIAYESDLAKRLLFVNQGTRLIFLAFFSIKDKQRQYHHRPKFGASPDGCTQHETERTASRESRRGKA